MRAPKQRQGILNQDIAVGLRNRDPYLLGRLIEMFGPSLLRYLLLLTGNRHTAEDIFQENWIRVLEKGYLFNGEYGFHAWLFSIARHLFIDLSRQKRTMSLDEMTDEGELHELPKRDVNSPLDVLCREEQETNLRAHARRLPRPHREVFLLRYDHEMKLGEIAEATRVPLSTVKSRLYRAATVLQGRLSQTEDTFRQARRSGKGISILQPADGRRCLSTA
ncbi:MAG: sigma-70 family RNA polymerase sigma factor [Acidobacteria bacterium]|nr:sigma-70 family RNA polymerase sigma factor [Acidobacteriota bacterium]